MKNRDISGRRMHGQHLWGPPLEGPEDVVRWLVAMQAQEYPVAKWSVAQRTRGVTNAGMDRAFADGVILRTHVLRPTWHFVLPEDIRWLLRLSAPQVKARLAHYDGKLGLEKRLLGKSNALLARAVEGRQVTREELATRLGRAGIAASGQRLAHILMHAELDAVICSGALMGKRHTYASLDERVPRSRSLNRDEALAGLTRRYFTARGPATLKDYLRWSNLTAAEGKSGLEMVKSGLEHETIDGRTYWFAASSAKAKAKARPSGIIDLVQGYDECILSYGESRDVLLGPLAANAIPRLEIGFTHAVLLDGRLIGHWRPALERKSILIETYFYQPLGRAAAKALDTAVARYGRFMGMLATLR
jgi:hypothetical protein